MQLLAAERSAVYQDNTRAKIFGNWLFPRQAEFAEFSVTPLTLQNAAEIDGVALDLLHYSPQLRVIEKLIESATLLNHDAETLQYLARYRAVFPTDYALWV